MVLGQLVDALNNLSADDVRNILFVVAIAAVALIVLKQMSNAEGLGDENAAYPDELDAALTEQQMNGAGGIAMSPTGTSPDVGGMDVSGVIGDSRQMPQFADTTLNAEELLPSSNDPRFIALHPRGGADKLSGRNFLASKPHFGVDTQGSSLRNANRQLRSEPANPMISNLTPFNNSSIDPDMMRKELNIGSAPTQTVQLTSF